ncbi:MAG: asparagine synthase (glutamine-hydrolyzing) [Bacteroidota bacterium]
MCGIAGIFSSSPSEISFNRIKRMTDTLIHRGPDGEGFYFSESKNLAFGHRRLAIIDLSDAARQPMKYLSRYIITYNGEIYNYVELKEMLNQYGYRFYTTSDTEVILAMYDFKKEKCLDFFDGMFAFSIYDKQEESLFCARDRFGEKPFYYHYEKSKSFVFASEMKALFAGGIKQKVNNKMLFNFLAYNYVDNPFTMQETFFDNVQKLPAANYLTVNKNLELKLVKYWNIDIKNQNHDITFEQATKEVQKLFYESVSRRLRSDVPVGSCLSGGLDSSAVVTVIHNVQKNKLIKQKTFSARFQDFDKDEGKYMEMISVKTNAEAYFTFPDENILLQEIEKIYYHQEEPFLSASIIAQYAVMKLAGENGVKVLLDGQGADEIFGGYNYLVRAYFQELYSKDRKKYKSEWKKYLQVQKPVFDKNTKFYLQALLPSLYKKMELVKKIIKPKNYADFENDFYSSYFSESFQHSIRSKPDLNYMLYESTTNEAMQQILRYADRNSMAHSVEVRLPFLSHRLVEFLFTLPPSMKMAEGWTKYLLRKSFEHLLPAEITWRKDKIGFEAPQQKWMNNKKVKETIMEAKKFLVKEKFLNKTSLKRNDAIKDWNYWMAAKLFQ